MRIAFVLPGSGISGGVRSTQRYASGLLERGHDVSILYRQTPPNLRDLARTTWLSLRYRHTCDWLRRFAGPRRGFRQLTADCAGENDIIIAVGPKSARDVAPLPDICGVKVEHVRGTGQKRELVLEAWQRPWPKIVVADHLRRKIETLGYGPVAAVIPNGVDTSEYFPDVPEPQRLGVGTVWHKGWAKNPEMVLSVLSRLRAVRADLPLLVFGNRRRSPNFPSGTSYVRFPSIAVARRRYSQCRVWFCASRTEGLPNPILEAMACGCAVVSTECGGAADIIQDEVNGFLVPVGDWDALAGRILQLLDDEVLANSIVSRSCATVERFSWSSAVEKLDSALHSILVDGATNAVEPQTASSSAS